MILSAGRRVESLVGRKTASTTPSAKKEYARELLARAAEAAFKVGIGSPQLKFDLDVAIVRAAFSSEIASKGKLNQSRVSAATGLTRKEIRAALDVIHGLQQREKKRIPPTLRVLVGWLTEDRGALPSLIGQPIPYRGRSSRTFSALAKRYGADVPPRALLQELIRGRWACTTNSDSAETIMLTVRGRREALKMLAKSATE